MADEVTALQNRRRRNLDLTRAAAGSVAIVALAAAGVLWLVDANSGAPVLPGLKGALAWLGTVLALVWVISSTERRLIEQLTRIELTRYRDGYVDGYVDAARRREANHQRPTLRPVR